MSVLQVSPDSSVFGSRGGVTGVVTSYQCGKRRPVIRETRTKWGFSFGAGMNLQERVSGRKQGRLIESREAQGES
jgi:hypothetical protein